MDFNKIPQLNANRRNRCYCHKNCLCDFETTDMKPISTTSGHKFIKIRNENGQLKPSCERIQISGPNSQCTSRCTSYQTEPFNYKNFYQQDQSNEQQHLTNLTEQREWYEKSKETFRRLPDCTTKNFLVTDFPSKSEFFLNCLEDRRVSEINDFRLDNAEDCFSVLSKYSVNKRLGKYEDKKEHVCEFSYRMNGRGLLEPSQMPVNGKLSCNICGRDVDISLAGNGFIPIRNFDQIHKIVLEVKDGDKRNIPGKRLNQRRKKSEEPGNSLALIYQKKV